MRSVVKIVMILVWVAFSFQQVNVRAPEKKEKGEEKIYYRYTDEKGTVVITDDFSLVPEKYKNEVEKIVIEKEVTPQGSSKERYLLIDRHGKPQPYRDVKGRDMEWWKKRFMEWKRKYEKAKNRLEQIRRKYFQDPTLDVFARKRLQSEMQKYEKEMEKARDMIEEVLPEEARKAGVLPGVIRKIFEEIDWEE